MQISTGPQFYTCEAPLESYPRYSETEYCVVLIITILTVAL